MSASWSLSHAVLAGGALVAATGSWALARRDEALARARRCAPADLRSGAKAERSSVLRDRSRARRERVALRRELPLAVELLRVAVSAGATPVQAVELVATAGPAAVAGRLEPVVRALDLGRSFAESVAVLRAEPESGLAALADALDDGVTLGAPVEATLGRLADDLRAGLRRAAEARAATVPVRLLFPLVFLVLPAFGLLGIVPSLLAGLSG